MDGKGQADEKVTRREMPIGGCTRDKELHSLSMLEISILTGIPGCLHHLLGRSKDLEEVRKRWECGWWMGLMIVRRLCIGNLQPLTSVSSTDLSFEDLQYDPGVEL